MNIGDELPMFRPFIRRLSNRRPTVITTEPVTKTTLGTPIAAERRGVRAEDA
jgi:hypothetical protein